MLAEWETRVSVSKKKDRSSPEISHLRECGCLSGTVESTAGRDASSLVDAFTRRHRGVSSCSTAWRAMAVSAGQTPAPTRADVPGRTLSTAMDGRPNIVAVALAFVAANTARVAVCPPRPTCADTPVAVAQTTLAGTWTSGTTMRGSQIVAWRSAVDDTRPRLTAGADA